MWGEAANEPWDRTRSRGRVFCSCDPIRSVRFRASLVSITGSRREVNGPRLIGMAIPDIAGEALGKRGLAFGSLITDWDAIIGPRLGARTLPEKLVFPRGKRTDAVLHIRVEGPIALEIQHVEPQILERVNGFFGFRAVASLRLINAALPIRRPRVPHVRRPTKVEAERIEAATAGVEDPGLRAVLERFGAALTTRAKPDRQA